MTRRLRPTRPKLIWRGCREWNSDLKSRSLAPWSVMLCRLVALVRDAGIEPASSRLKGECISKSANPAQNLVGDAGVEPAWSRLRGECISHLCQSPLLNTNWCTMLESNQHRTIVGCGNGFRADPANSMVRRSGVEPASVGCRPTVLVR